LSNLTQGAIGLSAYTLCGIEATRPTVPTGATGAGSTRVLPARVTPDAGADQHGFGPRNARERCGPFVNNGRPLLGPVGSASR
jgi:hypothetical protein